jgi:hypothetical protein
VAVHLLEELIEILPLEGWTITLTGKSISDDGAWDLWVGSYGELADGSGYEITSRKTVSIPGTAKSVITVVYYSTGNIYLAEKMDEKDKQIIKILREEGRAGYGDIGNKIGLSEGAVRKRIKTLIEENTIRKFTVKIGVAEGAQAITLLATNPSYPTPGGI